MAQAAEHFFRIAVAKESSFKTAGSYTQMRGLKRGSTFTPFRERIPIESAHNSKGDRYAPLLGAQTFECTFEMYLHAAWFTDLTDLFQAAFGVKNVLASPTFVSSATNFQVTTSTIVCPGIVKLTGTDAKTYICPVDTVNAGVNTLGIGMAAAVTATAIVSPGGATGALFETGNFGGASDTFSIETDWAAFPTSTTQRNLLASGCALKSFQFKYARNAPLTVAMSFMGAAFTDDGGAAANVSDPVAWTAEGPSWTGDFFLTTLSTIVWTDTKLNIKSFSVEIAPPLVVERGANGLNGGSNGASVLPGSDILGFTRDAGFEGTIKMRVKWDAPTIISFAAQTPFRFFGVLYPGIPTQTPGTPRTAIYMRRLLPVGVPVDVVEDGGRYMDLEFAIERDRTTNGIQQQMCVARFN
jgi:hypothetical protein